jgi:hypothetical protein
MKKRETKRERHPDAYYAECQLPEGFNGAHHLRVPSPLQAQGLFAAIAKGGNTEDGMRAWGAAIGLAWHHEWYDLESVRGSDLLEFGEAVFEELHAVGYRMEWLILLADVITVEVQKGIEVSKEVSERLRFFTVPEVKSELLNSTSAELTMEISTPGTV